MLGFARGRESYAKASTLTPSAFLGQPQRPSGQGCRPAPARRIRTTQLKPGRAHKRTARTYPSAPPRCPTPTFRGEAMLRNAIWLAIDTAQALLDAVKIVAADR